MAKINCKIDSFCTRNLGGGGSERRRNDRGEGGEGREKEEREGVMKERGYRERMERDSN